MTSASQKLKRVLGSSHPRPSLSISIRPAVGPVHTAFVNNRHRDRGDVRAQSATQRTHYSTVPFQWPDGRPAANNEPGARIVDRGAGNRANQISLADSGLNQRKTNAADVSRRDLEIAQHRLDGPVEHGEKNAK